MSSNSPESLPEETQSMYSETGDSESLINDFQVTLEELYPGLTTEPEIFIENLEQEAIDSIHPAIREIMDRDWYPELSRNLKNVVRTDSLQHMVNEIRYIFPVERLAVTREVQEEVGEYKRWIVNDSRVDKEIQKVLKVVCPKLMEELRTAKETIEEVVGIYPENRSDMLFDRIPRRSERRKASIETHEFDFDLTGLLENLTVEWRSYQILYKIYPELLENPKTLALEVSQHETDKLIEQYGSNPGLIKNPELVKELSELELFYLVYTLHESVGWMDVSNIFDTEEGVLKTIENVRFCKFHIAKQFLENEWQRRLYEDPEFLDEKYWDSEYVRWFCFHEKFFHWNTKGNNVWKALEIELLMRALKDGHEEDIKEFLPEKDAWRKYVTEQGDVSRLSYLL